MRIEVENLTAAGTSFANDFAGEPFELNEDEAQLLNGPVFTGHASRREDEVFINGKITATIEVLCDRCLRAVPVPIETEFTTVFVQELPPQDEIADLLEEQPDLALYEGESIDLNELLRQHLILALPMRRICSDECRGLCPMCGADLNTESCACVVQEVDPRWAGLSELIN